MLHNFKHLNNTLRLGLASVMLTALLAGAFILLQAQQEKQPNMRAAIQHLKSAKESLQKASADKGGHRVKAIQLVNEAIAEVEKGIEADNKK